MCTMPSMSTQNSLQPASRSLHLVDVENLLGTPRPLQSDVMPLAAEYAELAGIGPRDHVVIASSHICASTVWYEWPGAARRLLASGPDGADNALLGVLACEQAAQRFGRVVIASGDGIFAEAAARLQMGGTDVTVVCGVGSLARRLQMAVLDVRQLEMPQCHDTSTALRRAA